MTQKNFLNTLTKNLNETVTENGDLAHRSTLQHNLDVFFGAGAVRYDEAGQEKLQRDFIQAYHEDASLAIRNLINIRNFRMGGMGERKVFQQLLNVLRTEVRIKFLPFLAEIGRWDDVMFLWEVTKQYDEVISAFLLAQLQADTKTLQRGEAVSLLAKWMPTDNQRHRAQVNQLVASFNRCGAQMNRRDYRKMVSLLRQPLNLVETNLSQKNYAKILLEKLPSRAFNKYKTALWKYKEEDMRALLERVEQGEVKIKTAGITPDELIKAYIDYRAEPNAVTEAQWQSLYDLNETAENVLVMADVSGSMTGKPMEVSIGLAIYFAERLKGAFHNRFMTFSKRPELVTFKDSMNLYEKVKVAKNADWGMNTNFNLALQTILRTAQKSQLSQEDFPQVLLVVSDMQFDSAEGWGNYSTFTKNQADFEAAGYTMPAIVFWNVDGNSNVPVTINDGGVALVSGFSPMVMDAIMKVDFKNLTPEAIMTQQLSKPEYIEMANAILEQ